VCFPYRKLPKLEKTALIFDVSPATLKRKLKSVGTTYRQLLDRLRFDIACDMRSDPQLTIRDIALELGYSGTNNFVCSFHRMTGLSPGRYRQPQKRPNWSREGRSLRRTQLRLPSRTWLQRRTPSRRSTDEERRAIRCRRRSKKATSIRSLTTD